MSGTGRRAIRLAIIVGAGLAVSACMNGMSAKAPSSVPPSASAEPSAAPVKAEDARFAFGSITGIPGGYFQSFSAALDRAAAAKKLTVVRGGEQADLCHQGICLGGQRSHRRRRSSTSSTWSTRAAIVSTASAARSTAAVAGADPWSGITGQTVADAAKHAVDSLAEWVKTG